MLGDEGIFFYSKGWGDKNDIGFLFLVVKVSLRGMDSLGGSYVSIWGLVNVVEKLVSDSIYSNFNCIFLFRLFLISY